MESSRMRSARRPQQSTGRRPRTGHQHFAHHDAHHSSNPSTFFVGGHFSAGVDDTEQLNAVLVDSNDWPHGAGPGGSIPFLCEAREATQFAYLTQHDLHLHEEIVVEEGLHELATQFANGPRATTAEVGESSSFVATHSSTGRAS